MAYGPANTNQPLMINFGYLMLNLALSDYVNGYIYACQKIRIESPFRVHRRVRISF
jgi:hypothetical protein